MNNGPLLISWPPGATQTMFLLIQDTAGAMDLATKALQVKPSSFEAYYARARARRDERFVYVSHLLCMAGHCIESVFCYCAYFSRPKDLNKHWKSTCSIIFFTDDTLLKSVWIHVSVKYNIWMYVVLFTVHVKILLFNINFTLFYWVLIFKKSAIEDLCYLLLYYDSYICLSNFKLLQNVCIRAMRTYLFVYQLAPKPVKYVRLIGWYKQH